MTELAEELTLETVLEIWQSTTARLEQTHLTLQAEVRRLTEELEEKNRQLAKKNRLADLGQMAGHVAHEVRNHLVPLTLYTNLLRRNCVASGSNLQKNAVHPSTGTLDCLTLIDRVESGLSAMSNMVHDMLNFTANRQPRLECFNLVTLFDELIVEIRPQCEAQAIHIESEFKVVPNLNCDPDMLRSAVRNIIFNAIDAMPNGGRLTLGVQQHADRIQLEIADTGPGISANELPRIFDPFYTTKQTGTGLGLSIVERVMECHNGQVLVQSTVGQGTSFILDFSLLQSDAK